MTFLAWDGTVLLTGHGRPVRLSPESVDQLLSIFDAEGAAEQFNDLYQAHINAGGIPRVSSERSAA